MSILTFEKYSNMTLHPDQDLDEEISVLSIRSTDDPVPDHSRSAASNYSTSEFDADESFFDFDNPNIANISPDDLTPIIKQELKYKIQTKRLIEGKDELTVEYKSSEEYEQLSADDIERRKRRRENNRTAAHRCREKKKERADILHQETEKLEEKNESLRKSIESLKDERQRLSEMFEMHEPLCKVKRRSSPF